jgi:hypothetical protein
MVRAQQQKQNARHRVMRFITWVPGAGESGRLLSPMRARCYQTALFFGRGHVALLRSDNYFPRAIKGVRAATYAPIHVLVAAMTRK